MQGKMNALLKKAKRKDYKEISKIYKEEFSKPPYNEPWTEKKALKKIKLFSKYCDIFKITNEKDIIGFIIVNPHQFFPGKIAFGEEMAIQKDFQGKGIGTKVLKEIFKIYKKRGFEDFKEIALKKAKALELYKKIGFKIDNEELIIYKNLK
jgi:aminoglycoside 6'-N-acetyltransferase I